MVVRQANLALRIAAAGGLICLFLGGPVGAHAQASRKIALVIGNNNYDSVVSLANSAHDADLVGEVLRAVGFQLVDGTVQHDVPLAQFKTAIADFSTAAANADVGVFYYAGHGLQLNGINYLVPVDANPVKGAPDVPKQMIDASTILGSLDKTNLHLKMIILDACRNNPFASRSLLPWDLSGPPGLSDMTKDMASMSSPTGTVIWYATQPGNVALDGAGDNGPFALAISHNIDVPGRDLFGAFNSTGLEVMQETHNRQQPWLAATPMQTFFFVDPRGGRGVFVAQLLQKPLQRLQALFSSGVSTRARSFSLDDSFTKVNSSLDSPLNIPSWKSLPQASEFKNDDVRYFWVPITNLPVVMSAIVPPKAFDGHPVNPASAIIFFFKNQKLFHISIRLRKSSASDSYEWLLKPLFPTGNRSITLQSNTGSPTLVNANDLPEWTVIEITKTGVADMSAVDFKG